MQLPSPPPLCMIRARPLLEVIIAAVYTPLRATAPGLFGCRVECEISEGLRKVRPQRRMRLSHMRCTRRVITARQTAEMQPPSFVAVVLGQQL